MDEELLERLYKELGPRLTKTLIEEVHAQGGGLTEVMLILQGLVASVFLTYIDERHFGECLVHFAKNIRYLLENGERIPMERYLNTIQREKMN